MKSFTIFYGLSLYIKSDVQCKTQIGGNKKTSTHQHSQLEHTFYLQNQEPMEKGHAVLG